MSSARSRLSAVGWAIGGLPILASLAQTVLAALGLTAEGAGLGGLVGPLHSVAVFEEAGVIFWESPTIVLGLFVLIAACWGVQGAAMFVARNRDVTFWAAGVVALYAVLYLGVYSRLFGRGLPAWQLAVFFAIPIVAVGGVIAAAYLHDWESDLVDDATRRLTNVRADVDRARERFESSFQSRIGDLDVFREVAPNGVDRAQERREGVRDELDRIEAEADDLASDPPDGEEMQRRVAELEERVEEFDPEGEVEAVESELRDRITSGVRTTFGDVTVWSEYDRSYNLVNLPSRFREPHVSAFGADVHLDRLDDAFLDRIERGTDLTTIAQGLEEVADHLDRVESHVRERETEFTERERTARSNVETVEEQIEEFDGDVRERLQECLVEGRIESDSDVEEVRESLEAARDALHDCRFDEATHLVEGAVESSEGLVTTVEFLRATEGSIEHRNTDVSIPEDVDRAVVEAAATAFEREYGVSIEVAGSHIRLDHGDEPERERDEDDREDASREGGEHVPPEEIIDSVLYVFRELRETAEGTDGDAIELQTERLPDSVATSEVLYQIELFGERQTDVIESVEVQSDAPPGFIEVIPKDGVGGARAMARLQERYQDRYGER